MSSNNRIGYLSLGRSVDQPPLPPPNARVLQKLKSAPTIGVPPIQPLPPPPIPNTRSCVLAEKLEPLRPPSSGSVTKVTRNISVSQLPSPVEKQNRRNTVTATSTVGVAEKPWFDSSPDRGRTFSQGSAGSECSSPSAPTLPTTVFPPAQIKTLPVVFPRPSTREMEYIEREHPRQVFEYLNKMRERGDLCDVTLIANNVEIRAHKVVLAACSSYFESMFIGEFAEPDGQPIYIDEVGEDQLTALVDFAYTSRIKLMDQNIHSLFAAADLLQFNGVKGACFKFFKTQLNKSNCIKTWLFAEDHMCSELIDASLKFIQSNFLDIVRGREFLGLDLPDIVARIASLEDVAVLCEEQVYEAVMGWLYHDIRRRKTHTSMVLRSVRLHHMNRDYLMHIVDNEPCIKDDEDCLQQMIDALELHVSAGRPALRRRMMVEGRGMYSNMAPRAASTSVEKVEIHRNDRLLGLRIMGGADRPGHVFRQGDKPGIFILMVTPDGAAHAVGKLKPGDRILRVNDVVITNSTHDEAIRMLKMSQDPLVLLVRHEPPPTDLQELTLVTKPGEGFGFAICGGLNGYPGNPLDETDEGIFISQIIEGGAAANDGRLTVGTRILQVNSVSFLGKTLDEAMKLLHSVLDRMNLLVCHGYDPHAVPQTIDTVDEFGYVGSEPVYDQSVSK